MQLRLLGLLAISTLAGFAADVTGTWHGKQIPSGSADRTFVFKTGRHQNHWRNE